MKPQEFMRMARDEALRGMALKHGGPFGALVVRKEIIVSRAHNEVLARHDPTAHAEILAIRRAAHSLNRHHLEDCVIFSTCEPCPMCLGAVAWARIPRVYFGCTRDDAAAIGFSDRMIYDWISGESGTAPAERIGLGREACLDLFKQWQGDTQSMLY